MQNENQETEGDNQDGDKREPPPLDKLPTNTFLEKFMEEDEVAERANRLLSAKHHGRSKSRNSERDDAETVLSAPDNVYMYDDTGQVAYEKACSRYNALPVATLRKRLGFANSIDMRHYNMGPKGAMALSVPLLINTNVTSLNLTGNDLTEDGVDYILKMMEENTSITELNLSDNNLKSPGAKLISDMLAVNHRIKKLDISGNNFSDLDAKVLSKPIEDHPSLTSLNLSNNAFGEQGGSLFGNVICENAVLQEIDLSWNHIRMKGATDIAKGVKDNVGLKTLKLAWNGFGDIGAVAMSNALKTCTLTELDLTSNRISADGFLLLIRAIRDNDDMKTLRLCKNPISRDAAFAAMDFFSKLNDLTLELLDMGDCTLGSLMEDKVKQVQKVHTNFTCIHGYTDLYGKRRLKRYDVVEEAMRALNKYCDEHQLNIVELFSRFDSDGSMSVSHDEFKEGLREARVPVTDEQINQLIKTLDEDGDGEIDYSEMVLGAEMYRDVT